ncbi:MAG: hypothetical protein JF616_01370 [Fibrobacteres bacterium]|jgi:hypothetical protein|nr:hypothetical protein [Fibrobacterota bacterium]
MRSLQPLLRILSIPAVLCAIGCIFSTDEKVAGGAQDFPNTVTLGTAASTHIDDHTGWDQFSVIPSSLPTFADAESLVVDPDTIPSAPKIAAGKISATAGSAGAANAALSDTLYWDLSDTATLKVVRLIRQTETAFKLKGDTVTWRYGGNLIAGQPALGVLLESKGAETLIATGRRTGFRYENTDSAGGFDRAIFLQKLPALLPAGFKYKLLIVLASPEGKFDVQAGARPAFYAYARTRTVDGAAPDTTESFEITDADGDGVLWGAGDSGVVEFKQKTPNPSGRPTVDLIVQRMRAILFKDESRTYPVSFHETRTEKDGKKVVFSVRGVRNGEDSTFEPGDTAWVTVQTDFPDGAKMVSKTAKYKVELGGEPKRFADNKLLHYSLEATWHKNDSLVTTSFTFAPSQAVPSAQLSINGALDLSAALANGHSARAIGTFLDKIIEADVTDTDKVGKVRRYHAKWTAQGVPISQSKLP